MKKEAKGETVAQRYSVSFVPKGDKQKMKAGIRTSVRSNSGKEAERS